MSAVHAELTPFFDKAESIQPFIDTGTIWGIRFMDEPHDPKGFRNFEIDPNQLGEVYALIKSHFKNVRVGSTSPAFYMIQVPHADYACGQYNHGHPPPLYDDPVQFFTDDSALAHQHGLDYVASLNANTNTAGNYEFFETYNQICSLETVDFVTSWQWSQSNYLQPCFELRLNDPDPAVQALIAKIPGSCKRNEESLHLNFSLDLSIQLYRRHLCSSSIALWVGHILSDILFRKGFIICYEAVEKPLLLNLLHRIFVPIIQMGLRSLWVAPHFPLFIPFFLVLGSVFGCYPLEIDSLRWEDWVAACMRRRI